MDQRGLPGGRARVPGEAEPAIQRELTEPTRRLLLGFGAAGAWLVTAVFVVVGDGVESSGTGVARVILEFAHQGAWLLIALALTWAVARQRWSRVSTVLALGALVLYGAFVLTLLGAGGG